jgi:hypothetical protein
MPTKRRVTKRRISERDVALAWEMFFVSGHDFFGDLHQFGLHTDEAAAAAASEVWNRHGANFMANWVPGFRRVPWALENFGPPPRPFNDVNQSGSSENLKPFLK